MAIAYNLPSEREAAEENFSRLNRLLAELYEVLCHILVSRQPGEAQDTSRRDRPYSESDADRPAPAPAPPRRSATSPPLTLTFDSDLDDDVFISPRLDNGNDPFTNRPVEIFSYASLRTPAGVPLSPRRERTFTFSVSNEKHWRDKGGTRGVEVLEDADVTDAPLPPAPDKPSLTSFISDRLPGSICTAVLVVLGWKLLLKR